MKTCETSIILSKTIDPIQQTQQNKPNTYLDITFFKSQQLKKKKRKKKEEGIKGYEHEILREK